MSSHAKRNLRPSPRVLGAVTGVALLLGGGFAAQAVADSGTPKVTTTGDAAPQAASQPAASKSTGTPKVTTADKSAAKPGTGSAPAENAPRVIKPGSGAQK
ncbi:hypothetical protein [Streptomyces melanogenes]|uniref:hypothetical protein n=1 Tax=Streptomyces melanogenes TaxID=67326 RepID=UPI00167E491E|nr:hypothetical protein [Streptomyces melanogenes]GGP33398.1 hypothetical protein GCM10010278_06940 [Streptomyces melanogenes]